jgi:class 3 adenylate cyclase
MIVKDFSFVMGIEGYLFYSSDMVIVNLLTIFSFILVTNIIIQINGLHRKGELLNYITGKYHHPKEVERVFLFIDMSSSTTIAERLGHIRYGSFLQEYYLDASKAVKLSKGETYDYVGDEVIISWPLKSKDQIRQCVDCIFHLRSILKSNEHKYREKYDFVPGFKAGAHGGKVLVMWVGDDKKEIIYVGDVLNTAKRIQSECKRLNSDFLISGDLAKMYPDPKGYNMTLVDDLLLKGKTQKMELYNISGS